MPHTIVHFEVPAEDVGRAKKFYHDLFGWNLEDMGGDYTIINTGDGGPNGGMMKRMAPGQQITNYFSVEDVDEYTRKAQSLGAKVLMPKTPVPQMGWFSQLQDTEGNVIALWQVDENAH